MSNQDRAEGEIADTFRGDNEHLVESIKALIYLSDAKALVPHGLGGHARGLLSAAACRLTTPQAPGADTPGGRGEAVEREDDYIVPKSVYEDMLAALADREAIGFISEESLAVLLDKDGYQKWVEICNTNSGEGKPRIPLRRGATAHVAKRIEGETPGAGVLAVMDRAHMELLISDRFDEASEIGLARESISSLLHCSKSLAEVYDAMGSPRGPSRIMLDVAIARCKGTVAQAYTRPAESSGGDAVDGYVWRGQCIRYGTDPETGLVRIEIETSKDMLRDGPPLVFRNVTVRLDEAAIASGAECGG